MTRRLAIFLLAGCALLARGAGEDAAPAPKKAAPVEYGIRKRAVPCSVCAKTGRVKLHPPDYGQNQGSIHAKDHWDVKAACPACKGKGRRIVYRTQFSKVIEEVPPCRTCGWTGVEKCRRCQATGLVRCPERECKNGWIVHKNEVGTGRNNRHYKMSVEPCPACKGLGKIVCPECRGLEGQPCRTCKGLGKDFRK